MPPLRRSMRRTSRRTARRTSRRMNRRMDRREQAAEDQAAQQQPAPATGDDDVARLRELATLHDSGALTDEEFAAAKAKILS